MARTTIPARPIRTREEAAAAIAEIGLLWGAPADTPGRDRLEVLAILVEDFERKAYPEDAAVDPVEVILHRMEAMGLTRKDLEPMIGARSRVSDILNRRRALSLDMIRKLSAGLRVSADLLVRETVVAGA